MRASVALHLFGIVALLFASGCTAGVATLQPATVRGAGEVEASAGLAVHVPVENTAALLKTAIDGVKNNYATNPNYAPTESDRAAFGKAAVGLFFNPPAAQTEFAGRVGVGKKIDLGIRLSGRALHLQGKWQFLDGSASKGWDGALVLGAFGQVYSTDVTVSDFTVASYATSHIGGDASVLFGKKYGDYGFFWAGPRYQIQRTAAAITVLNGVGLDVSTGSHLFGAVVGGAVGYKYVYFMAELTGGYVACKPEVLGTTYNVGGTLLVPAFGLLGRF